MVAFAISDEAAVEKFLKGEIKVKGIHKAVETATAKFSGLKPPSSVEEISDFIKEIERFTEEVL